VSLLSQPRPVLLSVSRCQCPRVSRSHWRSLLVLWPTVSLGVGHPFGAHDQIFPFAFFCRSLFRRRYKNVVLRAPYIPAHSDTAQNASDYDASASVSDVPPLSVTLCVSVLDTLAIQDFGLMPWLWYLARDFNFFRFVWLLQCRVIVTCSSLSASAGFEVQYTPFWIPMDLQCQSSGFD
jgi:hypothetical protein